jgi:hypothetical protein
MEARNYQDEVVKRAEGTIEEMLTEARKMLEQKNVKQVTIFKTANGARTETELKSGLEEFSETSRPVTAEMIRGNLASELQKQSHKK